MAAHLINAGHDVFLNTRSTVPAELLTGKAVAVACDSIAGVVSQADIIFLMLPDTPDVAKVLFGEGWRSRGVDQGQDGC